MYSVSVWHGDTSLALIRNNASSFSENFGVEKMLDNSGRTFWLSDSVFQNEIKTITVDFFVSNLLEVISTSFIKFDYQSNRI